VQRRWSHADPHEYDAGKKVKARKRPVLVDTRGLVLHAIVTAADIGAAKERPGCQAR
jgi:hypothetical protein